jgi:hypothetical protein
MKADVSTTDDTTLAASIAPEDLKCGDFVAVLNEVIEFPSFLWFDVEATRRDELVRVRYIPSRSGMPLKVKAICLPFVFVKSPIGESETVDIRNVQLVRLNKRYGKAVWKKVRKQQA